MAKRRSRMCMPPAGTSNPAGANPPASIDQIDPDCEPAKARDASPSLVEDPDGVCPIDPDCDPEAAQAADPSLVEDPDGVCPSRTSPEPDGDSDDRSGAGGS